MHVVSVKTNTVLVSKNLAQAQFRCLECQKVFISSRHLEKHISRRHYESIINQNGSIMTGQDEVLNFNDRKLIEVAERLENVLSLLETRATESVNVRPSTAWVGPSPCASPDNLSPILEDNIYVLPSLVSEMRKPVSLFTLPKEKRLDQESKEFGAEDAELRQNLAEEGPSEDKVDLELVDECTREISNLGITVTIVDEREKSNSADSTKLDNIQANSENVQEELRIPTGIECKHIEAAGTLGPLIVDLISKLEQVSIEPKRVMSSCSQTSPEKVIILDGAPVRQKSVRFSEHPITINDDQEDTWQTESESVVQGDHENNRIVENDENPSCSESAEEEESLDKSVSKDLTSESGSSSGNRPVDRTGTDNEDSDSKVESGEVNEIPNSCRDHDECVTPIVSPNGRESKDENTSPQPRQGSLEPEAIPDAPRCSRSPSKFAHTKQQILDLVEKCIKDMKQGESDKLKASEVTSASEEPNNTVLQRCSRTELEDTEKMCGRESDYKPDERGIVCVKYETEPTIPGLMIVPSSIICKDGGLDIDDMSGNSYERFMKRYSSSFLKDRQIIEEQINMISLACKTSLDSGVDRRGHQGEVAVEQSPGSAVPFYELSDRRNKLDSLVCHKDDDLGLNKSEYAVLLHHETSQVQNLIDTLLSDLQRWRDAKRNELSRAVRVQLEEGLSSNLNLLGIQNKAKTLSDRAMGSAIFMLDNRRSRVFKGPNSSYFDTLKTAFVSEIDRIAKSRNDYPL